MRYASYTDVWLCPWSVVYFNVLEFHRLKVDVSAGAS